jgi:hypothetical protein
MKPKLGLELTLHLTPAEERAQKQRSLSSVRTSCLLDDQIDR